MRIPFSRPIEVIMQDVSFFEPSQILFQSLVEHLHSWGLRQISDETQYEQWQKDFLTNRELADLNRLGQQRSDEKGADADIQFYDLAAKPNILPVLYSQRFDYYVKVGSAVAEKIGSPRRILDFGCGVGILTTFYAQQFPQIEIVGIDRSSDSLNRARSEAVKRGLVNLHFKCSHLPFDDIGDSFDLIICTQSLFQAEKDPGLTSSGWDTCERTPDTDRQQIVERRTKLHDRLNGLSSLLHSGGRMIVCEKAWHLGRRILLQRALASREFHLLSQPIYFRYQAVDEVVKDGPLLEVSREKNPQGCDWDERPHVEPGESLFRYQGQRVDEFLSAIAGEEIHCHISLGSGGQSAGTLTFARWKGCLTYVVVNLPSGLRSIVVGGLKDEPVIHNYFSEAEKWTKENLAHVFDLLWPHQTRTHDEAEIPLYENHSVSAQGVWASLPGKHIVHQKTFQEQDGREMHIEWGTSDGFAYLYWANTYDQRQLVVMGLNRKSLIHDYYQESVAEMTGDEPTVMKKG